MTTKVCIDLECVIIAIADLNVDFWNIVLTWISIYWFSRAGAGATTRIYHEVFGDTNEMQDSLDASKRPQDIPFGVSRFPKEVQVAPKAYVVIFPELIAMRLLYTSPTTSWTPYAGSPLVFEVDHTAGGHFAAYEQPAALAGDLKKMFGRGGGAFGVVTGNTGY